MPFSLVELMPQPPGKCLVLLLDGLIVPVFLLVFLSTRTFSAFFTAVVLFAASAFGRERVEVG